MDEHYRFIYVTEKGILKTLCCTTPEKRNEIQVRLMKTDYKYMLLRASTHIWCM